MIGSNLWSWQRAQPTVRPRNAPLGRGDHVGEVVGPLLARALDGGVADHVVRPGDEEAGRRLGEQVVRADIAGELLADEIAIGQVAR